MVRAWTNGLGDGLHGNPYTSSPSGLVRVVGMVGFAHGIQIEGPEGLAILEDFAILRGHFFWCIAPDPD